MFDFICVGMLFLDLYVKLICVNGRVCEFKSSYFCLFEFRKSLIMFNYVNV